MTKKDFEIIAGAIREERAGWTDHFAEDHPSVMAIDGAASMLASALAQTNPRFDRERFIAACKGQDSTDSAGRTVRYSDAQVAALRRGN
jgi:hypothetical protein